MAICKVTLTKVLCVAKMLWTNDVDSTICNKAAAQHETQQPTALLHMLESSSLVCIIFCHTQHQSFGTKWCLALQQVINMVQARDADTSICAR